MPRGTAALRARLLGELELRLDGTALPPLESARAESLLAFLLVHREAPQPRQRLAFELWPDSTEAQARTNLRHVLHNLRRGLPELDRLLEVTARTLRWRVGAIGWLDVAAFEEALSRADGGADGGLAALRDAVALYRGDLLEGRHDEWLLGERERLRQRFLGALERLVALLEAGGEHAEAIGHAERLLAEDPLAEEAYRLLMRLHDARGDRARPCAPTMPARPPWSASWALPRRHPPGGSTRACCPPRARPRRGASADREVRSAALRWWDARPSGPG